MAAFEELRSRSPIPPSTPASDATLSDPRYDPWHGAYGPSPSLPPYNEDSEFFATPFDDETSGNLPPLTVYDPARPYSTGFNAQMEVNEFEVTAKDAQLLLNLSRTLLSDLSILHGEFVSKHSLRSNQVLIALSGYTTLEPVSKLCASVDSLWKRLDNRDALENDLPRAGLLTQAEVQDAAFIDHKTDHALLEQLYNRYRGMRQSIAILRCKLEGAHPNELGVYDYEHDARFQLIGNQRYPVGYKRQKSVTVQGSTSSELKAVCKAKAMEKVKEMGTGKEMSAGKKHGYDQLDGSSGSPSGVEGDMTVIGHSVVGTMKNTKVKGVGKTPTMAITTPTVVSKTPTVVSKSGGGKAISPKTKKGGYMEIGGKIRTGLVKKKEVVEELEAVRKENKRLKVEIAKLKGEVVDLSDSMGGG